MRRFITITDAYNQKVYVNANLIRSVKDVESGGIIAFDKDHTLTVKERAQTILEAIEETQS